MDKTEERKGYLALCYHYVRSTEGIKKFPRILGNTLDDFYKHIRMLKRQYGIISLNGAYRFSYEDFTLKNKKFGMLITFDDGLADHYLVANILAEQGIKAVFFIPTCILKDNLPANPTIVHYSLAMYGIERFLDAYRNALEEHRIDVARYDVEFERGVDNPWHTISIIKSIFNYGLEKDKARKVPLHIYKNSFLRDYPNGLEIIHLTTKQVRSIIDMGHFIGVHSHSHISIAARKLAEKEFEEEIIEPKEYLEREFHTPVISLSYPFGGRRDCLFWGKLIDRTKGYRLAFTVEKILNVKGVPPFELGRYMPTSTDDAARLKKALETIIDGDKI